MTCFAGAFQTMCFGWLSVCVWLNCFPGDWRLAADSACWCFQSCDMELSQDWPGFHACAYTHRRAHTHTVAIIKHTRGTGEMQARTNVNRLITEMQIRVTCTHTPGLLCGLLEWQSVGMLEEKPGGGICWRKTCWMDGGGVRWRSRTLCCLSFLSSARKHYRESTILSRALLSSLSVFMPMGIRLM